MILLSVPALDHPYVPDFLDRLQGVAEDRSHHVITAQAGEDLSVQTTRLDSLEHFVDGIVLADLVEVAENWAHHGTPIVSVGVFHSTSVDWVGIDLLPGVTAALKHLVRVCQGPICMLTVAGSFDRWDARHTEYARLMTSEGREPAWILSPTVDAEGGRRGLLRYIETHGPPDGLFCNSDHLALGAYRALFDVGARIPDDVAVVACDGIIEGRYINPPLATVVQPLEQTAERAWDLLRERLEHPDGPVVGHQLEAPFELRGSALR
jgi:LacI family transcriptional regulator